MTARVVTCSSCRVGLRLPAVTVASIFKCPKCQARVRAEPEAAEPVDEWIRVDDEAETEAAPKGALGSLKDWVAKSSTKIKDALNISGVSMKLEGFPELLPDASGSLSGRVVLTSGTPRVVHKLTVALAGNREMDGVLGTLGTMASYIQNENDEFFLVAACEVQNGLASPRQQRKVVIVP